MRHLLSIADLSLGDVHVVLDTASAIGEHKRWYPLNGRTVANLFYEDSTRTRISFELASKNLGADVMNFSTEGSSVSKGEGLKDTALTLQALGANAFVVRHASSGAPQAISNWVDGPVVNAGDGTHEHPTQALLDLYTMREHFGGLAGLRVGIVGDIRHSRVAHSLQLALAKMGAEFVLIGPRKLVSSRPGPYVSYDLERELPTLDVCYMLRAQKERHASEYDLGDFSLTEERAAMLPTDSIVMHPGPMNRGSEIASLVADSPRSRILDQVTNGVLIRSAVLWLMLDTPLK